MCNERLSSILLCVSVANTKRTCAECLKSYSATAVIVPFPDPSLLCTKKGLVYKVGILGCAESACSEMGNPIRLRGLMHLRTADWFCNLIGCRAYHMIVSLHTTADSVQARFRPYIPDPLSHGALITTGN